MKIEEIKTILKAHVKRRAKITILSNGLRDQCPILQVNYQIKDLDNFKKVLQEEYGLNLYHHVSDKTLTILCFDVSDKPTG